MSDLIDRQELLEKLRQRNDEEAFCIPPARWWFIDSVIDLVEDMPTAEPKKGELVLVGGDVWACSRCGQNYGYKPNYCSNCGADVRGAEND